MTRPNEEAVRQDLMRLREAKKHQGSISTENPRAFGRRVAERMFEEYLRSRATTQEGAES